MGFWDARLEKIIKIQADTINYLIRYNDRLSRKLYLCLGSSQHKPNPVRLALTTIINNSKFIIMALSLKENQFALADLSLVDQVTGLPISDAAFSNVVVSSSDETAAVGSFVPKGTVFTADVVLPDGTTLVAGSPTVADYVKIAGVDDGVDAPGSRSADVTTKAQVAYTNSLGEASTGSVVVTGPVTVTAVQTADGVVMVLTFGPAQTQF